ncbi:MAG: hypothetical protein H6740_28965 [Alphaproteobacteria bacterium]|nr:hypothetical protein [Alphaproteobacteria bacterium]
MALYSVILGAAACASARVPPPPPDAPQSTEAILAQRYSSPEGAWQARCDVIEDQLRITLSDADGRVDHVWDTGVTINRWHGLHGIDWPIEDWLLVHSTDIGQVSLQHTAWGWTENQPECAIAPDRAHRACLYGEAGAAARLRVETWDQHPATLELSALFEEAPRYAYTLYEAPLQGSVLADSPVPSLAIRWTTPEALRVFTTAGQERLRLEDGTWVREAP